MTIQEELQDQAKILASKLTSLTNFNGRDTLKDLKASLHYFETVAQESESTLRQSQILNTRLKLSKILARVENEIDSLTSQITKLQVDMSTLFEQPDLQKHAYGLRAVLRHDGLYGRSHIYSHVRDEHGIWWRTDDHKVMEVSEEAVLTDSSGLHLGAGPYMLVYSRVEGNADTDTESVLWPVSCRKLVEEDNLTFRNELPNDLVAALPPLKDDIPLSPSSEDGDSTVRPSSISTPDAMDCD